MNSTILANYYVLCMHAPDSAVSSMKPVVAVLSCDPDWNWSERLTLATL